MAEKKLLQWHSAFYASIQIELENEAEYLIFEQEHTLSTKPMQIDVLIIKKSTEKKLKKNIGRIFRKYNIVEYKSPDDYLSIDDFYKVYGYTCFYKSDAGKVNEIKTEDLTITLVCNHYPRELIKHLREKRQIEVTIQENGIYYIHDVIYPIQLLVTSELSKEENLWLKNLTNDIVSQNEAESLLEAYQGHEKDERYSSVMDIIIRANQEKFEEANKMCKALEEIREKQVKEEVEKKLQEQVEKIEQNQLLRIIGKKIAKGKTLEQIADELEETVEAILPLYNKVKGE